MTCTAPEICDLPIWSPLYVLRSTHRCPRCSHDTDVVALVADRYDDCLEDSDEVERSLGPRGWLHPILLSPVVKLPSTLAAAVRAVAPGYTPAPSPHGVQYLANHCRCGCILPDADLYGPKGPFHVESLPTQVAIDVIPFPQVQRITCDFAEEPGIAVILDGWWRATADEVLDRLRKSTKAGSRSYAVALGRALACIEKSERRLRELRQNSDRFAENPFPDPGPEGHASLESWADVQVWDPLFLMWSKYRCWRCGEDSPVAALLAERHVDTIGGERPALIDPPPYAQHVVRLSGIERMSPELEQALAEAAPLIRRNRSRMAGKSYYMNHCHACGSHFGDYFLAEIDGPFWAASPEALDEKGIFLQLLPVEGMQLLHAGTGAGSIYVWAHERWWRASVQRLVQKLTNHGGSESVAYAAALQRVIGHLDCLEINIDHEYARLRRVESE